MQQLDIDTEKRRISRMLERIRNHAAIEDLEALTSTVNALDEMLSNSPLPQKIQDQVRLRAYADEMTVLGRTMERTLKIAIEGHKRGRRDVTGGAVKQLQKYVERWKKLNGDPEILAKVEKELADIVMPPAPAEGAAGGEAHAPNAPPAGKTNNPPSGREQRRFLRYTYPKLTVKAHERVFEVADWSLNGLAIANIGTDELAQLKSRGNTFMIELYDPDSHLRSTDKAEIVRHDPLKRVLKLRFASMTNACSEIARELRRRGIEPR
jgi:hypothetical protein